MKIFFLLARFPYPLEKGDKLRAYNHIKNLSIKHEIHLCALTDTKVNTEALNNLKPYTKSISVLRLPFCVRIFNILKAFFNNLPFQVGYFYNTSNQKKINQLINEIKPDRIFCQMIRVTEYVKETNIKKTLDYQDVLSKGIERRIANSNLLLKQILFAEYKRLVRYEENIFEYFNQKTIISYPDRDHIPHPYKESIQVVPNGVDQSYFQPQIVKKEFDIVFTGNMSYPPNINSAEFLAEKIFPLVLKRKPNARLMIAGANPSHRVKGLKSQNIIITGWVDDIRTCYAQSRIFVAPMRIGTGLQNKLLEAMSMNIPCITSDLANNALGAKPGKEILIGNSPELYAEHILNLLENEDKANEIAANANKFIKHNFNWVNINEKLEKIICS